MDSPQSVVSPFKNLTVSGSEPEIHLWNGSDKKAASIHNPEDLIGILDVFIHQARDVHNICIYHKQDVYAKLCLTSDPESGVSTQIINGGGRNPVFNENLRLNVRTIEESSLKCEIWMLSRVRNYLEDQLLGFALIPLSEILIKNGKVDREFSLSSTELFHSPAGCVQLSISYSGTYPDVITIPKSTTERETRDSVPKDFENIEFPDPKVVSENQMMVSEYYGIECNENNNSNNLDSQTTESSDTESHELGVRVVESFSANSDDSKPIPNADSPLSSVSTNASPSIGLPATSQSSEAPIIPKYSRDEENAKEGVSESSNGSKETYTKPVFTVNIEPEEKMVQQDIVDMYMKSMQQFTESLAKMKLPMEVQSEPSKSEDSSPDQKLSTPKRTGPRVFYGSRAFF